MLAEDPSSLRRASRGQIAVLPLGLPLPLRTGERGAHLVFQGVQGVAQGFAVGVDALGDLLVLVGQLFAESVQVGLGAGNGMGDAGDLLRPLGW